MNKYELTLWTDEMVFVRGACSEQINRYSKQWRKTFIEIGTDVAEVYLPAINACRSMIAKIDKAMPPIRE